MVRCLVKWTHRQYWFIFFGRCKNRANLQTMVCKAKLRAASIRECSSSCPRVGSLTSLITLLVFELYLSAGASPARQVIQARLGSTCRFVAEDALGCRVSILKILDFYGGSILCSSLFPDWLQGPLLAD